MRYLENETSCLHPVTNTMVVFVFLDDLPSACGCLLATGTSTTIILCSLNTPIKGVVILVAFTDEKAAEEFARVRMIRFVVEAECTSVVEEDAKFIGETMAEDIGGVVTFFSIMWLYFCFLVAALSPCHERALQRKYINK